MHIFQIYNDKKGGFRFRLLASNGQIILKGQAYTSEQGVRKGIEAIGQAAKDKKRFIRKVTKNGQYYFNLKAANGKTVGTSSKFFTEVALEWSIKSVTRYAMNAEVENLLTPLNAQV